MKNKKVYIFFAAILIIVFGIFLVINNNNSEITAPITEKTDGIKDSAIIYYFGKECPHCVSLQKFIDDNKVSEKIFFTKKEVWHNPENAKELNMKAKECNLKEDEIGVPFLYADGKCFVGGSEVENFFKTKIETNKNQ